MTHKYTVANTFGTVIGAFNNLQDAIDYANSRAGKYGELFVRDTSNYKLMHYAKRNC